MAAAAHDLAELLDLPCCECFNADDDHPLRNALAAESRDDASLLLESDVDEELLVILRFRQLVKVSQIALKAPSDKGPRSVKARGTRPSPSGWVLGRSMRYGTVAEAWLSYVSVFASHCQVFCNPIGLGIDTAKSEPASQTMELDAGQIAAGCKLDLRFVLFQKVSSLALFFPDNHEGGERTVVERLAVYGMIVPQEGAAWAKDKDAQEATAKGDWLGKKSLG